MRKITRSKHPEKRRNTKWNASGSTLAMNRQVVDTETVVYAMMCAMIASLILSSILPMFQITNHRLVKRIPSGKPCR